MRFHLNLLVACATFIASLFAPMAVAVPVDFFTTPITGGTTQSLANLSGTWGGPYTLPSGNIVSGGPSIVSGIALSGGTPNSITFYNLGGVNEIGFNFTATQTQLLNYISGITFDNGESWTGGPTYLIAQNPVKPSDPYYPFAGFHTTNTFTSATLIMAAPSGKFLSSSIVDFTTATAAVPEPSTIVSGVIAASVLAAAAHRNYRRRKSATV